MKYTKLIALLLALVMVLALAACGSSEDAGSAEKSSTPAASDSAKPADSSASAEGGEEAAAAPVSTEETYQLGLYGGYAFIGALDPIGGFCPMVTWGLVNMLYDTLFFTQNYEVTSRVLTN